MQTTNSLEHRKFMCNKVLISLIKLSLWKSGRRSPGTEAGTQENGWRKKETDYGEGGPGAGGEHTGKRNGNEAKKIARISN